MRVQLEGSTKRACQVLALMEEHLSLWSCVSASKFCIYVRNTGDHANRVLSENNFVSLPEGIFDGLVSLEEL